jgi:arylsulfatase A-like enzyme
MKNLPVFIVSNLLLFIAVTFLFQSCAEVEKTEKPVNFVIIYLDDMGYGDMTNTGAIGYKTPNLDQMASQGLVFHTLLFAAGRLQRFAGRFADRLLSQPYWFSGAHEPCFPNGISADEETLAEVLKKKGYATAIYGKWHLGVQDKFLPTRHGFDEFYGIPYSNDMWPYHPRGPGAFPDLPLFENETIVNPAVTPDDQKKFTTEFTERTLAFIKKKPENPFFVYLAHPMPHVPLYVSEKFEGKSEQGLYGDVMMEIDWSVGQVIQTLKETGLEENTLVIFTSDNGPWLNYGNHAGTTGGLREGKGTTFEGGQRVPCLMYWKGTISPGTVNNALVAGIDILPTLAEIANAPLPEKKIDGVNILPLIKGEDVEPPRKSFWYYYRRNSLEAVQDGNWKLVFPHPGRSYVGFEPGNDGQPGRVNENFPHEGGLLTCDATRESNTI